MKKKVEDKRERAKQKGGTFFGRKEQQCCIVEEDNEPSLGPAENQEIRDTAKEADALTPKTRSLS